MKKVLSYLTIFLIIWVPSIVLADSQQLISGLNWLISAKNGHEYWGCKIPAGEEIDELTDEDIVPTYFRDTCEATETLSSLHQTGTDYNNAINWIYENKPTTTEQISKKIEILSRTSFSYTDDLNLLLSYQNSDGGFGGYKKLRSDIVDSIFSLRALKSISYQDNSIIEKIIQFVINNQNSDGGWGFKQGRESSVYYTALVSSNLQQFSQTTSIATAINKATTYLIAHQNTDGGFGGSPSTVFETSLAYLALVGDPSTSSGLLLQNAVNYLTSTQLSDGSWDDDPYSTALALRALANVKPNLSISSADIIFSNPTPTAGETITITADVKNSGIAQASGVSVQFYDGDPSSGGTLIEERTITSIGAFGSSQASINYTIPTASSKTIYVKIDLMNSEKIIHIFKNKNYLTKNNC